MISRPDKRPLFLFRIQSGIGVPGLPGNTYAHYVPLDTRLEEAGINFPSTAFGLYRDGTELRGVYYAEPEAARSACSPPGVQCEDAVPSGT